jgi:hypothetical protein
MSNTQKIYFNDIELHIKTIKWATECFIEMVADNQYKEFWINYARFTENQNPQELSTLAPITQMIDKITGFYDESMCKAFDFFMEFFIEPIMPNLEKEWETKEISK